MRRFIKAWGEKYNDKDKWGGVEENGEKLGENCDDVERDGGIMIENILNIS